MKKMLIVIACLFIVFAQGMAFVSAEEGSIVVDGVPESAKAVEYTNTL